MAHTVRTEKLFDALTLAAILGGSTLRLAHFWSRGVFWGDEAALGYNLLTRSYLQLTQPLDLHQAAPVGFLMLEKLAADVCGMEENILRLPAMIAGIATLVITAWSYRSLFGPVVAAVAAILLAFSPEMIRYSAELKSYTFDSAIAVSLFALFAQRVQSGRRIDLAAIAVAGVLAPWFSLPSVFVLAGCGGCLILRSAIDGNRRLVVLLLFVSSLWVASFALEYFLCLKAAAAEPELIEYWSGSFAPFPLRSVADLRWYAAKAIYLFEPVVGLRARHVALAVFLIGLGLIWKRRPLVGLCMVSSLVAVLAASAVGKYPFNGRLTLFLMPILMLPIATCFEKLFTQASRPRIALGLILLGSLILQPTQFASTRVAHDFGQVGTISRNLAMYRDLIAEFGPGDQLCVSHEAAWGYRYYSVRYGFSPSKTIYLAKGPASRIEWITRLSAPGHSRTWLLLSLRAQTAQSEASLLTASLPATVRVVSDRTDEVLGLSVRGYETIP